MVRLARMEQMLPRKPLVPTAQKQPGQKQRAQPVRQELPVHLER